MPLPLEAAPARRFDFGHHGTDHVLRGAAVWPDLSPINVLVTDGPSKLTRRNARLSERFSCLLEWVVRVF